MMSGVKRERPQYLLPALGMTSEKMRRLVVASAQRDDVCRLRAENEQLRQLASRSATLDETLRAVTTNRWLQVVLNIVNHHRGMGYGGVDIVMANCCYVTEGITADQAFEGVWRGKTFEELTAIVPYLCALGYGVQVFPPGLQTTHWRNDPLGPPGAAGMPVTRVVSAEESLECPFSVRWLARTLRSLGEDKELTAAAARHDRDIPEMQWFPPTTDIEHSQGWPTAPGGMEDEDELMVPPFGDEDEEEVVHEE